MPWRENEGKANNVKVSTPEDERFIFVYRLGDDGDLKNEGNGMLSVWA